MSETKRYFRGIIVLEILSSDPKVGEAALDEIVERGTDGGDSVDFTWRSCLEISGERARRYLELQSSDPYFLDGDLDEDERNPERDIATDDELRAWEREEFLTNVGWALCAERGDLDTYELCAVADIPEEGEVPQVKRFSIPRAFLDAMIQNAGVR